ncbi:MAG: sensor histidine kinase [Ktedonobacterales bacterium]
MRHEHERDESQDATYLAGMASAEDAAPHGALRVPPNSGADSSGETDPNAVVALTQTLVAPLPPRSALLRALALGPRLLPRVRSLALYMLPDGTRESLTLAGEVEPRNGGAEMVARDVWQQRTTLGHGGKLDRRTLDERAFCRVGGTSALPLISPELDLVGALVVEGQKQTRAHARFPLLDVLASCLTVLIERYLRNEAAGRRTHALTALSVLTLSAVEPGAEPDGEERARDAVLSAAADALRELALPLASTALTLAPDGPLRMTGTPLDAPALLDAVRAAELLAALHGEVALTVSAGHASGIWEYLVTLREQAHTHHKGTGRPAGHMTLLPIRIEGEVVGVLALAHAGEEARAQDWLPAATAIAIAAGAGLRALRLADAVAEEARARDEFISLAAHELRSPLTSTRGYAQLLARQARKASVPAAMLRSVAAIEEQSLRMAEMVSELLDASRIRRGMLAVRLASADLVPLAQKVVEKRQLHYPRHTISLQIEAPSLAGNWDAQRVEQIVRDLLDNAARYSPEGGAIFIRLTETDRMAMLCVRDEGTGVAPEDRSRIFDYLYRAPTAKERNLSGLGLGLFICQYLAEHMGGRLVLHETAEGKPHGSEFRLTLPLAG